MPPTRRLEARDTPLLGIAKLSEGVPRIVEILDNLFKYASMIDPYSILGGAAYLVYLDELGIYCSDIGALFRRCNQNVLEMATVLRAYQLGILTDTEIRSVIDSKHGFNTQALFTAVQAELPGFGQMSIQKDE
jgi:hypothetical protein